jgi:hypothetical protein
MYPSYGIILQDYKYTKVHISARENSSSADNKKQR